MGRMEEILSAISPVPITLVHSQSRQEYTGESGQTWRAMIPAKPPLIRDIETVSSSQRGARMAINQTEMDTARARM